MQQVTPAQNPPQDKAIWWTVTPEEAIDLLKTDPLQGLSQAEVSRLQGLHGPNTLPEKEKETLLQSLLDAFKDPLGLVLTGAAILSAIIGIIEGSPTELQQAGWIMAIVVFMTLVSFYTDYFADREMDKLKSLQVDQATAIRGGERVVIESKALVPGDVIVLGQGDKVPSDARIIEANNATANEQLFTGEPYGVEKSAAITLSSDTPLSQRANMVFGGSFITSGTITAVITSIGVDTELGRIWEILVNTEEAPTPLQQQLEQLGKFLLLGTLVVCVLVVTIYVLVQQYPILEALVVAVALAIAFIPEALGAIIVIALALGAREMVKKQTIIRENYAAEGLGSVSVVCTDKTGTITYGNMSVTHLWGLGIGEVDLKQHLWTALNSDIQRLIHIARYNNNLKDPTDKALGELVTIAGQPILPELRAHRRSEVPFDSTRKRMSTLDAIEDRLVLQVKGAPQVVLPLCREALQNGAVIRFTERDRQATLDELHRFESEGYRVLALCYRDWQEETRDLNADDERDLVFAGLVAISDPARPEVRTTLETLHQAGIQAKMITGDSPVTALSIARDIRLNNPRIDPVLDESLVITGTQLAEMVKAAQARHPQVSNSIADQLNEQDLQRISRALVFSRVTPEDKVTIVAALQRAGKLVAMVGDGINDAPAIKQSNVGIAMVSGTDLAKAVSRAVLTGTYEAIASAVEVGRTILYRARLYIHALLSTNGAEVGAFIVAALAGLPTPLTAVQLLVINLLGDSWLSIALATEKAEPDVMQKPPRPKNESVITPYMWFSIGLQSVITTIIMMIAFLAARDLAIGQGLTAEDPLTLSLQQTAVFITFMVQKILRSAFTARSLRYSIFQIGVLSNRWSLIAAGITIGIALLAINVLPVGMTAPPADFLPLLFGLGVIPPIVEEAVKWILRRNAQRQ
ncbi:MAG: cation-transporting P-type ATPase [Anaerolineae bacterium]|jgi:Ca2+-transporting ATPase|nr:cation-transporting P-type ATPase [Anaerolineae bacterium]